MNQTTRCRCRFGENRSEPAPNQTVDSLPGIDSIHNIVLQECKEVLVNNLYFIYCTILELNTYPIRWLIILTIVLQKAGKAVYNVAKAYQPIGLLKTLGKLFSTLIVADLSYLTEKHQLLPPTQFGGCPNWLCR